MKDRLVLLRKTLKKSQQEFADRLNIKRGTIANYECGRNEPIDAVVTLICKEFDVNETWLRTGEGEMFVPRDRETELAKLTTDFLLDEPDSFRSRFISLLARMSDEEWKMVEDLVDRLAQKKE